MSMIGLPWYSTVKNLPVNERNVGLTTGWENLLEGEMATHSNIIVWRIPWTVEPDGLQSMGS